MKSKEILSEEEREIIGKLNTLGYLHLKTWKALQAAESEIEEKDKKIDSMAELLLNYDKLADRANTEIEAKDKEIAGLKMDVKNLMTFHINTPGSDIHESACQREIFNLKNQVEDLKLQIQSWEKGMICNYKK